MNKPKIKAYAILAGGGVKGAALAGALQAAEEVGIDFLGYGGCSAGSLVALLAALRYSNDEIRGIVLGTDFKNFLEDDGEDLKKLRRLFAQLETMRGYFSWTYKGLACLRHLPLLRRLHDNLGLYGGKRLAEFVHDKIRQKIPALERLRAVNFSHLAKYNCKSLKIIASDIERREAVVYSSVDADDEVSHAIRASVGFPFVFQPVHFNGHHLVDGGLASNLPVDLFQKEREGAQVIAFDLKSRANEVTNGRRFRSYCGNLLATALEAGDTFYRQSRNIHYISIATPETDTLDFFLSTSQREQLWDAGRLQAYHQLSKIFHGMPHVALPGEACQVALNVPPVYTRTILKSLADEVLSAQTAKDLRPYVFLVDEQGSLLLVEQRDSVNAELRLDAAGGSPIWNVFATRAPKIADLVDWAAKSAQPLPAFLTGRRSFFGVPLFDSGASAMIADRAADIPVFGVLGIDAPDPLAETQWQSPATASQLYAIMNRWAGILARLLQ